MRKNVANRSAQQSHRRGHRRRDVSAVCPPVPPAIAQWWKDELAAAQAEYRADTGEAMPMSAVEMKSAARLAGFTAGEAVAGDYSLADIHEMAIATRSVEQRQAAAVAEALRTVDPLLAVDKYDRAIAAMSVVTKRAVVGLLGHHHTIEKRSCLRRMLAHYAGCTDRQMKDIIEHEIRPIEKTLGFKIIDSKNGVGYWLMPEGVEVATRIAAQDAKKRACFPAVNR